MQTLTAQIAEHGYRGRPITAAQLRRLLPGSDQRRHHLVNRALKANELIRLRRGLYVLKPAEGEYAPHPFAVAQAVVPGSYVSLETALEHHGWIPEAVYTTASITPHRKRLACELPLMDAFVFRPLAIRAGGFLELVDREVLGSLTALVATPLRALMDLVCLRKLTWQGMDWFEQSMRIDTELLHRLTKKNLRILKRVYRHRRMQEYLDAFALELNSHRD